MTLTIEDLDLITGVEMNYYIACQTKLWLFTHFLEREKESEIVQMGKLIEEMYYKRSKDKDVLIDNKINIDIIETNGKVIIHEVKKSSKLIQAHIYQLLYYMYYLHKFKGVKDIEGVLNYPKEKRIERIFLDQEKERMIEDALKEIKRIKEMPKPPKPIPKPYCKTCAYRELCYS